MTRYPDAFIRAIPKTDLHVHLDGSLRLPTLIELARERGVALPSETEEGLNELVFKPSYRDLDEYLKGFAWSLAVMQDIESLERTAYELALDNWAEGVRYLEVRFAPQLHMSEHLAFAGVMTAVDRGLRRARTEVNRGLPETNRRSTTASSSAPCGSSPAGFSAYYADLLPHAQLLRPAGRHPDREPRAGPGRRCACATRPTCRSWASTWPAASTATRRASTRRSTSTCTGTSCGRPCTRARPTAPSRSSRPSPSCTRTASATACTSSTRT